MDSKIWGPHAWFFLHSITFYYPDHPNPRDKKTFYNFFQTVGDILPCTICKNHYKENLIKYPIENHLDSRDSLVNWLIDIHNSVNKKLNKPLYNNIDIIDKYNNIYKKKNICLVGERNVTIWKNILLVILLILNIIFIVLYCLSGSSK